MEHFIELWDVIDDSPILVVGAVLFLGVASGRLIELARLPPITGTSSPVWCSARTRLA